MVTKASPPLLGWQRSGFFVSFFTKKKGLKRFYGFGRHCRQPRRVHTYMNIKYSVYTLHGSCTEVRSVYMSFVVARMQKMKSGNLVGVGNHNQRNTDNHSNKDIDVERSYLNYDLVNRTENYKRDIEQFINDNKSSSRAVRKDAVLINEWIITSDNQFFKDKDDKEIKDCFEQSKDYFAEKFGDENIRYAQVHLDETTPHMHLGIVPFNAEKKLSAKTVFNRQALQAVQDELPKYLNERGFELERGEKGSERKNLTVPEYKKAKDELKEMTTTLEQRKSEVLALSTGDKRQALKEMLGFISDNNIMHLKDFADYCMSDRAPAGWFELLTERNTLFIKEYIKSNWQKENQVYKE